MMRRVLSLLLIPLVLASQGLVFAYSHCGTKVTEPAGHVARPHFHVRGRSRSACDRRVVPDRADFALSAIALARWL